MASQSGLRARLAEKMPELEQVEAAIDAHREGRAVTRRDPATGEAYVVDEDRELGTLTVRCGDRVLYRSRRKPAGGPDAPSVASSRTDRSGEDRPMPRRIPMLALWVALAGWLPALPALLSPAPATAQPATEVLASAGNRQLTRGMVADGIALGEFLAGQSFSSTDRQWLAERAVAMFRADPTEQARIYGQVRQVLARTRAADEVARARLRQELRTDLHFSPGGGTSPVLQVANRYAPVVAADPTRRSLVTAVAIDALFAANDFIAGMAGHPPATPAARGALQAELPQAFPGLTEGEQRLIANAEERWAVLRSVWARMTPAARAQTESNVRRAAPTPAHVPTVARNLEMAARLAAMNERLDGLAARYLETLPNAMIPSMIGAANRGFQ